MSHFTVLVPAKDEDELFNLLLPYYEIGCNGGTDTKFFAALARDKILPSEQRKFRYEFEPEYEAEEIEAEARDIIKCYSDPGRQSSEYSERSMILSKFVEGDYVGVVLEYTGGRLGPNGDIGHWRNPLRKWDWYQVGGRWEDSLPLKSGSAASYARVEEIDWEAMSKDRREKAARSWDNFASWVERVVPVVEYVEMDDNGKREVWNKISNSLKGQWDTMDGETSSSHFSASFFELGKARTREEYIRASVEERGLTWAFVDLKGNWVEQAEMGWWGMHDDRDQTYGEAFWRFIDLLPPEQMIYVVDCHI